KAEEKLDRDYAKRVKDAGQIYNSGQFLRRTPVVNLLIGLSIAVTLMTNFGKRTMFVINYINLTTPRYDPNDGWVIDSLSGALGYEPWRLIAPLFLHMSFLHILFNMSWLAQLGGMVEREKKSWFLLFLVLTTHIVASFTEYFWNIYGLQRNVILFGGFSGAVYGLIGFVWMYSEFNRFSEIRLSSQNLQLALFWMVLCFTGFLGPIANGAHFGGLVAGMIIGMISGRRDAQRQW
ncbi:MAG: Rhomboid protease GlpG, partial [Planctomycetota bacterium]